MANWSTDRADMKHIVFWCIRNFNAYTYSRLIERYGFSEGSGMKLVVSRPETIRTTNRFGSRWYFNLLPFRPYVTLAFRCDLFEFFAVQMVATILVF